MLDILNVSMQVHIVGLTERSKMKNNTTFNFTHVKKAQWPLFFYNTAHWEVLVCSISKQTRQQLFMFSFCHVFPIDDRNHKLLSSFYLMTSKSNLWSYSHGSLLLLKYLMLYIFFVRQCSPKIPLNTQKHETSVLVEYFTRGVEQTVK